MGKHKLRSESLSLLVRYYQHCMPVLGGDAGERIAMLLLLDGCRIAQRGIKIHSGEVQSHSSHRIIYSVLSWKEKLLPEWKGFAFFCLFSFKWAFSLFEPEFCHLRPSKQIIHLSETLAVSLMSGHQMEVAGGEESMYRWVTPGLAFLLI